jgi:hypothetical protein
MSIEEQRAFSSGSFEHEVCVAALLSFLSSHFRACFSILFSLGLDDESKNT